VKDRAHRLLEVINFYGNTFARISSYSPTELGETAVMLICAVLNYKRAAVLLRSLGGSLEVLAARGLLLPSRSAPAPALACLSRVAQPTIVPTDQLAPAARASALELGLGANILVTPLRTAVGYEETLIGFLAASDPREEASLDLDLDLLALDIIGNLVAGGIMSSDARTDLRRLNEQLEARVASRTSELEAANRELEAFSYSVSHDLRAPLRAIDGFSQALLEDYRSSFDDQGRDWLDRVRAAAQRMGRLIDDLLQLSRVTRVELVRRPFDLGVLAAEVAEDLRMLHPDRRVDFSVGSIGTVLADPRLVRIALENLLGNAWKFTRGRSPACVEVGVEQRAGQRIYLVRDNGVGFDSAFAHKLFQPFQRLHTEQEFEGSGVGLSVVQRIIRRHHGRVWAESALGHGATLYFTLDEGKPPWSE
jgi:signal transduction histidine kinase